MRNFIKTAALAIIALVAATSNVQAQGIYQHDIERLWQEGMVQVEQYNQTLDYYHQLYDRYDWSQDEWARGCYSAFDNRATDTIGLLTERNGRIFFAGEHTADHSATMEGAMASGVRAAGQVVELIG